MRLQDQLVVLEALNPDESSVPYDTRFLLIEKMNVGDLEFEWRRIRGLLRSRSDKWVDVLAGMMDTHVGVLVEAGISLGSGQLQLKPAIDLIHAMLRVEGHGPYPTQLKDQQVALHVLALSLSTGRRYHEAVDILARHNVGGHRKAWCDIANALRTDPSEIWIDEFASLLDPVVAMLFRADIALPLHRHEYKAALSYLDTLTLQTARASNPRGDNSSYGGAPLFQGTAA